MLLQTNSYIVPKEKRSEHTRLMRRFRQVLGKLGCDSFEAYEQVGANWSGADSSGRFVQIMRFRDRKHQLAVQNAEKNDPVAQALIAEFCALVNFPYQQQQGYFAVGFYSGVIPGAVNRAEPVESVEEDAGEPGVSFPMGEGAESGEVAEGVMDSGEAAETSDADEEPDAEAEYEDHSGDIVDGEVTQVISDQPVSANDGAESAGLGDFDLKGFAAEAAGEAMPHAEPETPHQEGSGELLEVFDDFETFAEAPSHSSHEAAPPPSEHAMAEQPPALSEDNLLLSEDELLGELDSEHPESPPVDMTPPVSGLDDTATGMVFEAATPEGDLMPEHAEAPAEELQADLPPPEDLQAQPGWSAEQPVAPSETVRERPSLFQRFRRR